MTDWFFFLICEKFQIISNFFSWFDNKPRNYSLQQLQNKKKKKKQKQIISPTASFVVPSGKDGLVSPFPLHPFHPCCPALPPISTLSPFIFSSLPLLYLKFACMYLNQFVAEQHAVWIHTWTFIFLPFCPESEILKTMLLWLTWEETWGNCANMHGEKSTAISIRNWNVQGFNKLPVLLIFSVGSSPKVNQCSIGKEAKGYSLKL